MSSRATKLRSLLTSGRPIVAPGVTDAFTARIIEEIGFEVLYLTGAGVTNTLLGLPDLGIITLPELVERARRISDAVAVPVFADCDTGFGGVHNVRRTVREYERAGLAGLHIEDQVFPKRCGHFEGKAVVPIDDMLYRLQAALDGRTDPDFLIIARTDARAVEGLDAALRRAKAYRDLGADALFVEAPTTLEELRRIGDELRGTPLIANMVENGKTPLVPADELGRMGFSLIIYANAALRLSAQAVRQGMQVLRDAGTTASVMDKMISFDERQRIVGLAAADAYEHDLVERVRDRHEGKPKHENNLVAQTSSKEGKP